MTGFNDYRKIFLRLPACVLAAVLLWLTPWLAAGAADANADVETVRQRLLDLQRERGIYDPALIEAWSDLAARLSENGDHVDAAESWQEALHVSRISDGLYHRDQLRIIGQLARAYEAADDREQADVYHHLLFHTRSRLYEPDSSEMIDAVIDWSDWKLQRSTERNGTIHPGSLDSGELDSLRNLQRRALDALRRPDGATNTFVDDARVAHLLRASTLTALGQASRILGQPAYLFQPPLVSQYITRRVCRTVSTESGGTQQVCSSRQVENPRYRQAQAQERNAQAERELRRARQALNELRDWQEGTSRMVLSEEELQYLEENVTRFERDARRHTFRGW